jgi:hypothetical protein
MLTDRVAIERAVLLQTTDEIPPIVPNPPQQRLRRIPGLKQHILWLTAQAVAGIAEQLQGQRVLRRAASTPEAHAHRDAQGPIRPDEQHQRQAIDGFTLLTGIQPCEALDRRRKGLGKHRISDDEIAAFAGEERAPDQFQECLPRPVSLQQSRQGIVGHGWQANGWKGTLFYLTAHPSPLQMLKRPFWGLAILLMASHRSYRTIGPSTARLHATSPAVGRTPAEARGASRRLHRPRRSSGAYPPCPARPGTLGKRATRAPA